MVWRRVRDSNPRFLLREHIISSDAPSTSRTTLRAIFQPNFSNLNLGKWREKLERKLFNLFNCTAKTPINQGFSRRGFQSDHWFSSQPRYDHFDNPPCIFPSAFNSKKFLERKAGENTEKYSIFDFENPFISRISGGRNDQAAVKFRVSPVMTTSIPLHVSLMLIEHLEKCKKNTQERY